MREPPLPARKTDYSQILLFVALFLSCLTLVIALSLLRGRHANRPLPAVFASLEKNTHEEQHDQAGAGVGSQVPQAPPVDADIETAEHSPRRSTSGNVNNLRQESPKLVSPPSDNPSASPSTGFTPATTAEVPKEGTLGTGAAAVQGTPLELPVETPRQQVANMSGSPPSVASPRPAAGTEDDRLAQVRYYVERMKSTSSQPGQSLPIQTPPPVAVPRELAQAAATPRPTQSVFQRVHNIPSHLIQTPLPLVTNAGATDITNSPAADPSLATDAGKAPRWSDPQHPLMQEVWGGPPPIPTVYSGTPSPSVTPQATWTPTPRATVRATPPLTPSPTSKILPPESNNVEQPLSKENRPPKLEPSVSPSPSRAKEQAQARSAMSKDEAEATPASPAPNSPAVPISQTPISTFVKEIRTTGEFTVRKGRAVVTFSNLPVTRIEPVTSASTEATLPSDDAALPSVSQEKITAPPGRESTPPPDLPRYSPESEAGSAIARGIEELAKRGETSKLGHLLASKAIAANVGDKLLTREALQRRIKAVEILRGATLNEDQRLKIEDEIITNWTHKTAVAAVARERGIQVTNDEVKAELERRQARFGQNLPAALRQAGFTEEEVEDEIRDALLVDKIVAKILQETYPEEKLRELYNASPDQFQASRRFHLREIFKKKIPGREKEAREALEKIRLEIAKGVSFEELAQRESDSPTTATAGDVGWIDASTPISPAQAEAIGRLKPGEVSDVIELGDGYQLLKLVAIEEPKPGFEGARNVVEAYVREVIMTNLFEEAIRRYEVKVRNKAIKPRFGPTAQPVSSSANSRDKKLPSRSTAKERAASPESVHTPAAVPRPTEAFTPTPLPSPKKGLFPFLKKSRTRD